MSPLLLHKDWLLCLQEDKNTARWEFFLFYFIFFKWLLTFWWGVWWMHESRCSPRITVTDHSWLACFFFFLSRRLTYLRWREVTKSIYWYTYIDFFFTGIALWVFEVFFRPHEHLHIFTPHSVKTRLLLFFSRLRKWRQYIIRER